MFWKFTLLARSCTFRRHNFKNVNQFYDKPGAIMALVKLKRELCIVLCVRRGCVWLVMSSVNWTCEQWTTPKHASNSVSTVALQKRQHQVRCSRVSRVFIGGQKWKDIHAIQWHSLWFFVQSFIWDSQYPDLNIKPGTCQMQVILSLHLMWCQKWGEAIFWSR